MKTMNAVNAVQLFILVWTFTAVCRADGDISVSCENVTGTVGKEVTFSCNVSLKKSDCCIIKYKFYYPEKYNDSEICREEFPPDSDCKQRNRFTCRFSSSTVMTEQFRFFVQTCGMKTTEFPVDITEQPFMDQSSKKAEARGFNVAVIAAAVSCFIIVIIPIIYKMKQNYKQKRNNTPENVI